MINMILSFEEYKLNEEFFKKSNIIDWAIGLLLVFHNVKGDVPQRYDFNFFKKYVKLRLKNNMNNVL